MKSDFDSAWILMSFKIRTNSASSRLTSGLIYLNDHPSVYKIYIWSPRDNSSVSVYEIQPSAGDGGLK